MEVTKQDGTTAEVPDGIVCWPCGSTCTVWPNMLMHIIADKLKNPAEANFRTTFFNVREKLKDNAARMDNHDVYRRQNTGYEVYCKLIFVTCTTFTSVWQTPASLKISTTKLPISTTGAEVEGVLFDPTKFPKKKVPHFTVKLSVSKMLEHRNCILAASDIMRHKQARELYNVRMAGDVAKRPVSLRQLSAGAKVKDVVDKFKIAQLDLSASDAQRRMQQEHIDQALIGGQAVQSVRRVKRGGGDSDEDQLPEKKQNRKGGAGGVASGGAAKTQTRGRASSTTGAVRGPASKTTIDVDVRGADGLAVDGAAATTTTAMVASHLADSMSQHWSVKNRRHSTHCIFE